MKKRKASMIPTIRPRKVEKPPYVVDRSRLRRFNSKDTIFERVISDRSWNGFMQMYDKEVPRIVQQRKDGYSRVDFALAYASWIVHDAFEGGFSRKKIKLRRTPAATIGIDWTRNKCEVNGSARMSVYVKRAAKLFGARHVGICKLNRDWLYADARIPRRLENVVVMAIEMDADGIATSPAVPAAAATGAGYSRMSFTLACLGEFIRNLGYEAIQCGNDTALSIPLAIDAGLGELGRNGLLITPQYGPRVRLCKIFTNLPLDPDRPIKFGVQDFCRKCRLCARNCTAGAISMEKEPSFEAVCRSNNPGALKWYVNVELCYQFWCLNGVDCSTCITVCPYDVQARGRTALGAEAFWRRI
jgi:epoxyqueuosine reductase